MTKQIYEGEIKKIKDQKMQSMMIDLLWSFKGANNNLDFGGDAIKILQKYDFIEK